MSAMRVIHGIEADSGKVVSFKSTTGALPAFESNNNPFGYKFSWSPRGVLLASRNPAKWLEEGKEVVIPGEQLFENYKMQDVEITIAIGGNISEAIVIKITSSEHIPAIRNDLC
jgi:saccharopine dehydrogenase-like NADP-dependent oxidoreductase